MNDLKKLISISAGKGQTNRDLQGTRPRRKLGKRENIKLEFKAWNVYFTFLNSPYVVSPSNHFSWPKRYLEPDSKFKIWNDVTIEAYKLKACGKQQKGERVETLLEDSKGMQDVLRTYFT